MTSFLRQHMGRALLTCGLVLCMQSAHSPSLDPFQLLGDAELADSSRHNEEVLRNVCSCKELLARQFMSVDDPRLLKLLQTNWALCVALTLLKEKAHPVLQYLSIGLRKALDYRVLHQHTGDFWNVAQDFKNTEIYYKRALTEDYQRIVGDKSARLCCEDVLKYVLPLQQEKLLYSLWIHTAALCLADKVLSLHNDAALRVHRNHIRALLENFLILFDRARTLPNIQQEFFLYINTMRLRYYQSIAMN